VELHDNGIYRFRDQEYRLTIEASESSGSVIGSLQRLPITQEDDEPELFLLDDSSLVDLGRHIVGNADDLEAVGPPPITQDELFRVMDALAFQEIDHHGPEAEAVHAINAELGPLIKPLIHALHTTRALGPGMQWTIPIGLSCGFRGQLIVRVSDLGPDHRAAQESRLQA